MTKIIDLSVGAEPSVFVNVAGWNDNQLSKLESGIALMPGFQKLERSAGAGFYVYFDSAQTTERDVEVVIRDLAAGIVSQP